jgi:DNA-binding NarL/FixJ family response regulator
VPAATLDTFWRFPNYVGTVKTLLGDAPPNETLQGFSALVGAKDVLGLVAVVDDISLSVGAPHYETIQIGARDRQLLTQVALHLESSLRLRVHPSSVVAVLDPDGRVLHAEGTARHDRDAREHLTRHVTRVERGRTRRWRRDVESVNAWSALISGTWGLVEQTERGGSRHYSVLEITRARHLRALTEVETHAVELSARGLTGKTVAYALGVSPSTVSKLLSSAALKLGTRSRTELVRLIARLLDTGPTQGVDAPLTSAERDVLALVRLGWTNTAISKERGRSERTVANQVASLLRKLQVPSRRALAAAVAR